MQTFLPFVDFKKSAASLDRLRSGKQRLECLQLLNAITGRSKGWTNHPAAIMWKGYERALLDYSFAVCFDWVNRGYDDTIRGTINSEFMAYMCLPYVRPHWLGDKRLHASHRAALLHKNPEHYSQFKWKEAPELNYFWPSQAGRAEDKTATLIAI